MHLICGMHRSGTSLIAGMAHQLGADLGDPDGFHPADRWNPDGYFEQREILAVNRRLVDGPWGRAAYLRLPSERTIGARARRLAGDIERLAERYRRRLVKENRFCLTLPAWRRHGATVDRLLIVFRHPLGVARSLGRRNHIPRRLALRLWCEHHRRLFGAAADVPAACLWYDRLVADADGAAHEGAKLAWLLGADPERVRRLAAGSIHFTRRPPPDDVGGTTAAVVPLFAELRRRSEQAP